MSTLVKRRNSTTIDDKALEFSLVRGINEDIEDFHKRVIKATSNLEPDRFKFQRSLEYITPIQGFEVFKITTNTESLIKLEISDTRILIAKDSTVIYRRKLEDIKFLTHLKTDLDSIAELTVELITDNSWEYLRAENLTQNTSKRTRNLYSGTGQVSILPDKDILNVQDFSGNLEENTGDEEAVTSTRHYAIEDGNVLHRFNERSSTVFYEYSDFPLFLSWSPIRSYQINGENFNDILNDRIKNAERFGIIDENAPLDNSETVEVLSQRGAKIINKILTKHNTYWGE